MPEHSDIHKFSIVNFQLSILSVIRITLFGLVYMLLSSSPPAVAAEGNISNTEKNAWSENAGWLNFRPADGGVTVHDTYLSGYAWGENLGWIKLGADSGGPYTNSDSSNWGVNCDPSGALSGYAWSENVGWINFNPTHGQVTYDTATGSFDGYAWGENVGWIHFKGISPAYNVLSPRLAVAGVAVAEGAGPANFSISLSRETGVDVTVDYATQDGTATEGSDYTATSGTATIPAGSTSASVEVPVTDDSEAESDETFVLVLSTPDGASIATRQATGTITSEDAAGIAVSPTAGLTTTEAGATASFEVVLESEPVADVTLGVSSSDTTEGTVSPADLVFTSGNWNTPQEVTVTGVDDAAVDGDQEYTIGTAQAVSADPNYSGVDPADVSVTNTDDDVAHHTLYVVTAGTGSGTVTSEPSGINCGKDCRQAYAADMSVLLTAAADDASVFVGWDGGGCSGTGSCTVTLDGDTTVTAQFEPQNSQGCTYSISPLNQFVAAGEGDSSVTVTAQDGCKRTAVSNTPWITVTSGVTGAGSGVVGYHVSENTETKARIGQLTVAGNVLTVMQAGTAETPSIKILWVKSDGTVVLTAVDADGNLIEPETFGPFPGWTPTSYHLNDDGTGRILWSYTDGTAVLAVVDAGGEFVDLTVFGPFPGWTPTSYHLNDDGTGRTLWSYTDGTAVLAVVDAGGEFIDLTVFGPFPGWTPTSYHLNDDGTGRILWSYTDGTAVLAVVDAGGEFIDLTVFGPFPGWTPTSYHLNDDGTGRILWNYTDGTTVITILDFESNIFSYELLGIFPTRCMEAQQHHH